MLQKLLYACLSAIIITSGSSCSEDLENCPSKMCVMAGGWQLVEVFTDDERDLTDLSKYRLILQTPAPTTATTSSFNRVQPNGSPDSGSWSIVNKETVLRLLPGDNPTLQEDWVIESFTPHQLILVITRNRDIKVGPGKIRFILEPF